MNIIPHLNYKHIIALFLINSWHLTPLFIFIIIYKLFLRKKIKGYLGELKVHFILKTMLNKNSYHIFKNILIPTSDEGTTQIDHVVVSGYGIFVIETKNMKGWIYGGKDDITWTQVLSKQKFTFQNPLMQNYKHIKILSTLLNIPENKFHSLIFFTGDCKFATNKPDNVLFKNYTSFIKNKTDEIISENEVISIIKNIESNKIPITFKTKKKHVRHVKDIRENKYQNSVIRKSKTATNFRNTSEICIVCKNPLTQYMLNYCQHNSHKLKGKFYCHKHLR